MESMKEFGESFFRKTGFKKPPNKRDCKSPIGSLGNCGMDDRYGCCHGGIFSTYGANCPYCDRYNSKSVSDGTMWESADDNTSCAFAGLSSPNDRWLFTCKHCEKTFKAGPYLIWPTEKMEE